LGDFADLVAVRLRGTLCDVRRAKQQHGSRRRFQNEGEAAIGINRDQDREDHSVRFLGRLGIELFAEIHDVQAMRTERGADGRRRRRFASRQLQLDRGLYLLWRHVPLPQTFLLRRKAAPTRSKPQPSFSTLAKSSSTGVERPKIVTDTFKRLWSLSISSTVPLKFAKGPSTIRTCSL